MRKLIMESHLGIVLIVVKKTILNVITIFIVKLTIKIFLVCNKWYVQYKKIIVHQLQKTFLSFLTYQNQVIFLQKQIQRDKQLLNNIIGHDMKYLARQFVNTKFYFRKILIYYKTVFKAVNFRIWKWFWI